MGLGPRCLLPIIILLSLPFHFGSAASPPGCLEHQRSALLQFKLSFQILHRTSIPRFHSWSLPKPGGGGGDCCSWDGVQCSHSSGYVIGLDLSYGGLRGSIDSRSSLFRLVHLRRLNLAHNHFNGSRLSSSFGRLRNLTYLNLSHCEFAGLIPNQILQFSKLDLLDLSGNPLAELGSRGMETLARTMTALRELNLSSVRISSVVPATFADLSSLKSLSLQNCGLRGEFPEGVFDLPNLQSLSLSSNQNLTGSFPEFRKDSRVQELILADTGFSGELPDSMGNLKSLNYLNLARCNFSGSIPPSMANLTHLDVLILNANDFLTWPLPSWLGQLSQLSQLNLDATNLRGEIPSSLANLTRLKFLSLGLNQLTGNIPPWISNLTRLNFFNVYSNKLTGDVPDSIFDLPALQYLGLGTNMLTGSIELDELAKLKDLYAVDFDGNNLSVVPDPISNATFPKMMNTGLGSCKLSKFPDLLRDQNDLITLTLDGNDLQGSIPGWFLNRNAKSLTFLNLSSNFLTGFEAQPRFLPWEKLQYISLDNNKIQGFLPVPSPFTIGYMAANNSFNGSLPLELCSLESMYAFDVSNNQLSGSIPLCFGSFKNLLWLNLNGNNFSGAIPPVFWSGCQLRSIDLNQNQLHGELPRSLMNCTGLEYLGIGNNQIEDRFPRWLGVLPKLKILILGSNHFHGAVRDLESVGGFPALRILDLSGNAFSGNLSATFFHNLNEMKATMRNSSYMAASFKVPYFVITFGITYSAKMTIKGVETAYSQILDAFKFIDLSDNKFNGLIPASIAELKGLQSLNLSNNYFTGTIPSCFGNLTELESLDISYNRLSGEIPMQLTHLTFLGFFNASYNDLHGTIPNARQFGTFDRNSYLGNRRLCGYVSSDGCQTRHSIPSPPVFLEDLDEGSAFELDWIVVSIGYVSGLVIGSIVGCILMVKRHEWFVKASKWIQDRYMKRI